MTWALRIRIYLLVSFTFCFADLESVHSAAVDVRASSEICQFENQITPLYVQRAFQNGKNDYSGLKCRGETQESRNSEFTRDVALHGHILALEDMSATLKRSYFKKMAASLENQLLVAHGLGIDTREFAEALSQTRRQCANLDPTGRSYSTEIHAFGELAERTRKQSQNPSFSPTEDQREHYIRVLTIAYLESHRIQSAIEDSKKLFQSEKLKFEIERLEQDLHSIQAHYPSLTVLGSGRASGLTMSSLAYRELILKSEYRNDVRAIVPHTHPEIKKILFQEGGAPAPATQLAKTRRPKDAGSLTAYAQTYEGLLSGKIQVPRSLRNNIHPSILESLKQSAEAASLICQLDPCATLNVDPDATGRLVHQNQKDRNDKIWQSAACACRLREHEKGTPALITIVAGVGAVVTGIGSVFFPPAGYAAAALGGIAAAGGANDLRAHLINRSTLSTITEAQAGGAVPPSRAQADRDALSEIDNEILGSGFLTVIGGGAGSWSVAQKAGRKLKETPQKRDSVDLIRDNGSTNSTRNPFWENSSREGRRKERERLGNFKTFRHSIDDVLHVQSQYPKVARRIRDAHDEILRTKLLRQVEDSRHIPSLPEDLKKRLDAVDPKIAKAIRDVWNRMNDPESAAQYMTTLLEDAAVETHVMALRGSRVGAEMLENGLISRSGLQRTIVKRHKTQGNDEFSILVCNPKSSAPQKCVKVSNNENFREAVRQGPFFDRVFENKRHGMDGHLIQQDYIADVVWHATDGNPQLFWDFIGSQKGIRYWKPLFDKELEVDSGINTFSRPEFMNDILRKYLQETKKRPDPRP